MPRMVFKSHIIYFPKVKVTSNEACFKATRFQVFFIFFKLLHCDRFCNTYYVPGIFNCGILQYAHIHFNVYAVVKYLFIIFVSLVLTDNSPQSLVVH